MKPYLCAAIALALLKPGVAAQSGANSTRTLPLHGRMRTYLLHVPPSPNGALVLAFHGGGQIAHEQETLSAFDTLSDREHVIVAYPQGIERSWADGRGTTKADRESIDDVGFAKAVVADVAASHPIDRARVYATGPSNGGIFTNRLGCDAADTFAAIAPVIGSIASAVALRCRPSAPIAVVGIQGVADPVVPFGGGEVGGTLDGAAAGGRVESSRATQALWAQANGCETSFSVVKLPVRVKDGTSVARHAYGGCRAGADVVWYEIEGGGHRWPPRRGERPMVERAAVRLLGVSSQNLDATEVIWTFFSGHRRSGAWAP